MTKTIKMIRKGLLLVLSLVIFHGVASGQKVKYKDLLALLNAKKFEQAKPFLKKYLTEEDGNPSAYLFMGIIYQEEALALKDAWQKKGDLIVNYVDSAVYYYNKGLPKLTDMEIKKNYENYLVYARRDLRTGEYGIKLSEIHLEIENRTKFLYELRDQVIKEFKKDVSSSGDFMPVEKSSEIKPNEAYAGRKENIALDSEINKTVTLVVSGQGKTQDEAKQNALRSAIEQAFGTFISSKTEILDDNLIKDEILTVANGNIQNFEIISEVKMPNGEYATSLKAIVSVTKLTSFVENKGVVVEFKGNLFALNVNELGLNEKNEIMAIDNLCKVVKILSDQSFDYKINVGNPVSVNGSSETWNIPFEVLVKTNSNLTTIADYVFATLQGLSLNVADAKNIIQLGKEVYPVTFAANERNFGRIILRSPTSIELLVQQLFYFNHSLLNFKISNGISEYSLTEKPKNLKSIYDAGFRVFAIKSGFFVPSSVFFGNDANLQDDGLEKSRDRHNVRCWGCVWNYTDAPVLNYEYWTKSLKFRIENFLVPFNTPQYEYRLHRDFPFVPKILPVEPIGPGLVISFIGTRTDDEIVIFHLTETMSLLEINKVSEWKVTPIRSNGM